MALKLLDTTDHHKAGQGYGRSSLHTDGTHLVRIEVHVDNRASQSYARAQLMTNGGWQTLIPVPAEQWFDAAPSYVSWNTEAADQFTYAIREDLARRAGKVLAAWKGEAA